METIPDVTPVTKPVELTLAMLALDDVQAFVVAGVSLPVNCVVDPVQVPSIPVMEEPPP